MSASDRNVVAESALEDAIARFTARNRHSLEIHAQALESMPDGNIRAQMYTYPFPVCLKSGKGYQLTSEDGHTYVPIFVLGENDNAAADGQQSTMLHF